MGNTNVKCKYKRLSNKHCFDKPVSNNLYALNHSSTINNTVTKKQTLSLIIHLGPTNTLKTKMTPLSSITNHKHHTKYIR